ELFDGMLLKNALRIERGIERDAQMKRVAQPFEPLDVPIAQSAKMADDDGGRLGGVAGQLLQCPPKPVIKGSLIACLERMDLQNSPSRPGQHTRKAHQTHFEASHLRLVG